MTMRSPPCNTCEVICRPFTSVPFVEPRSVRTHTPGCSKRSSACVRLALMSGMTMSQFDSRPIDLARGGKRERLAVRRVDESGAALLGAGLLAARCFLREDHGLGCSLRCGTRDCGACAGEGFPSVHRGFCPAGFFLRLEGLVVVVIVVAVIAIVIVVVGIAVAFGVVVVCGLIVAAGVRGGLRLRGISASGGAVAVGCRRGADAVARHLLGAELRDKGRGDGLCYHVELAVAKALVDDEAHERLSVHEESLFGRLCGKVGLGLAREGGVVAEQALVVVGVHKHGVERRSVLLSRADHLVAAHLLFRLLGNLHGRQRRVRHFVGCALERVFHFAFEFGQEAHLVSFARCF